MQPVGELQETTPATSSKLEQGAEGPYELEAVEAYATVPSSPASEHSPARSASSTYAAEGGLPPPSFHDPSEDSLARARLSSLSSIEQFCEARFNLSWTRSHSATSIFETMMAKRRAPVMEHQVHSNISLPFTIPDDLPPMPPAPTYNLWHIGPREYASSLVQNESVQTLHGSKDGFVRGRDLLGIRKWAKDFWKSRAHFFQKLSLGKAKKNTTALKDGESGNNERIV